jgi:PEP-CTERM motif
MKLSLRTLATLPCLAAFLAFATPAHADSITNGSFSSGFTGWSPSPTNGVTPGVGITVIPLGVSNDTGFGDDVPVDGTATHAVYFVDDLANESLTQSLSLTANTHYTLTFDLLGVPSGDVNQFGDILGVSVAGANASYDNFVTQTWTTETLSFDTGAATNYTLDFNFLSGSTPAKDIALTNITLNATPVPEPTSLALFGTGILGLAGVARRKFRS